MAKSCQKCQSRKTGRRHQFHVKQVKQDKFPYLHQPKGGDYGRCPTCSEYHTRDKEIKIQIRFVDTTLEVCRKKEELKAEKDKHIARVKKEREAEDRVDRRATAHKEELEMVCVDQTEGSSFPRERQTVYTRVHRLRTMAGGTLSSSTGTGAIFLGLCQSKGPNPDKKSKSIKK
eukprot:g7580.t1